MASFLWCIGATSVGAKPPALVTCPLHAPFPVARPASLSLRASSAARALSAWVQAPPQRSPQPTTEPWNLVDKYCSSLARQGVALSYVVCVVAGLPGD